MARKSRKNLSPMVCEESSFPGWLAAVYVRLSVEDTRTRTDSIETQQMIIREFLENHRDIQVFDTYIDNGTTGTNFQRPAFQRMLDDIESGRVNCVIVKDLSRLGRNSIDTGYYIERYVCRTSRVDESLACNGFRIPAAEVLDAVFATVKQQLMSAVPALPDGTLCLTPADVHRQRYEAQIAEIMEEKRLLFERFIAGEIAAESFRQSKFELDEMLTKMKSTFAALTAKAEEKKTIADRQRQRQQLLDELLAEETLSNELAERMIDRITVFPDKRIEITYKMSDLFE